jgi:hypothetical protein
MIIFLKALTISKNMGKTLLDYTQEVDRKTIVNWKKVAELIHQSDESQNYQIYDQLLREFAEKGLIYAEEERKRPQFSLASWLSPHVAIRNSNYKVYYFVCKEDAESFSKEVFKKTPGNNIFIIKQI